MMLRLTILSLAALLVAHSARAELDYSTHPNVKYSVENLNVYACLNGKAKRVIYVDYKDSVDQPPCAVVYGKRPPENPSLEIPWRADTEAGYCERKAKELIENLRGMGWKCGFLLDVPSVD